MADTANPRPVRGPILAIQLIPLNRIDKAPLNGLA